MTLNVNSVKLSSLNNVSPIQNTSAQNVKFKGIEDEIEQYEDTFTPQKPRRTEHEKQVIVKKAIAKAAGWSAFGSGISTLYYALRSNKTVADACGLDVKKDKELVQQIKNEQWKYTLPSLLIGVSLITGGITWAVCKNKNPDNIYVD